MISKFSYRPSKVVAASAVGIAMIGGIVYGGVVVAQNAQDPAPIVWDRRSLEQLDRNVRKLERAIFQRNASGQPFIMQPDAEVVALQGQVGIMTQRLSDLEATVQRVNADLERSSFTADETSRTADALRERLVDADGRIAKLEAELASMKAAVPVRPVSATGTPAGDFAAAMRTLDQGDYNGARRQLEGFVELWPEANEAPEAYYRLAETRVLVDDLDGAIDAYATALDGWPRTAWAGEATVKLAATLEAANQNEDACLALGEFIRRYAQASSSAVRNRATQVRTRAECD